LDYANCPRTRIRYGGGGGGARAIDTLIVPESAFPYYLSSYYIAIRTFGRKSANISYVFLAKYLK